jgi:hypothetical protein
VKPSDDVILLALLLRHGKDAPCADEVRGALRDFGFEMTAQQVASALGRLAREGSPTIDALPMCWWPRVKVYELTRFGCCQLGNRWPRLRPLIWEMEAVS